MFYTPAMDTPLTIGRLARTAGISTSAVRYYERAGLITPAGRTAGNYRYYEPEALERLRFIRAAQRAGFALDDVATLLALRDGSLAPCAEVEALIDNRLEGIARRMADFRRIRKELRVSLEVCRAAAANGHCGVLDGLTLASKSPTNPREQ